MSISCCPPLLCLAAHQPPRCTQAGQNQERQRRKAEKKREDTHSPCVRWSSTCPTLGCPQDQTLCPQLCSPQELFLLPCASGGCDKQRLHESYLRGVRAAAQGRHFLGVAAATLVQCQVGRWAAAGGEHGDWSLPHTQPESSREGAVSGGCSCQGWRMQARGKEDETGGKDTTQSWPWLVFQA